MYVSHIHTGDTSGDADLNFAMEQVNVVEMDGEMAEICVVLQLTAPVTALGCDVTVTLEVIPGPNASKPLESFSTHA